MNAGDTIIACISGQSGGAVSTLRISGPRCAEIAKTFLDKGEKLLSAPRRMELCTLYKDSRQTEPLDRILAVYFKSPKSFTGEDCLELSLHGSGYLLSQCLTQMKDFGIRLAEPGEFSRRAFLNGQIDLSQAEAIADLVASETEAQARVARMQMAGHLSQAISDLGEPLRATLAEIEAYIDFPDEDINPETQEGWLSSFAGVHERLDKYLASYERGKVFREGARVVLAGIPNAGKSSLLNLLAGQARAIVTEEAGTTRDSIETRITLGGLLIHLWDTAGLVDQKSDQRVIGEVERQGIARSWQKLKEADLVLFVFDPRADEQQQLTFLEQLGTTRVSVLINKSDIATKEELSSLSTRLPSPVLQISATSGLGLAQLLEHIPQCLNAGVEEREEILICNERHRAALFDARGYLGNAAQAVGAKQPPEIVSLELRSALSSISSIVGVTETEDILGLIFSKFCIGK